VTGKIFSASLFTFPEILVGKKLILGTIGLFMLIEWLQRDKEHALEIGSLPVTARWASYYAILGIILYFAFTRQEETPFIYFQF
jgi:hypothetical protein